MTKRKKAKAKKGKKNSGGRPPFVPSADHFLQVKTLAGMGIQHADIAKFLGITPPTMRKHFRAQLETGRIEANAKVAQSLFKMATGDKPNVAAAIFWMKARAGWSERDPMKGVSDPIPHDPDDDLGKKERADKVATTAQVGTEWDNLLPAPRQIQ